MDTFFDFNLMVPAKGMELADVGELAHGAVGLGGVEGETAFESHFLHNQLGKGGDGNLFAGADVDVAIADFLAAFLIGVGEIDVFEDVDAGIGHLFAPKELAQGFACTPQTHFVGKDAVLGKYGEDILFRAFAIDSFYGTEVHVVTYGCPIVFTQTLGQMNLSHHGRQDVAVFEVEIVVGAIEVGGHDGNVVGAVLEIETLAHLESGNLGDSVWLVGVFKGGSEQGVFLHGLLDVARIDAGAAQKEEFLHSMAETFADDILLDLQILVDEVGTIGVVGHDASHVGGGKDDVLGLFFIKEALYGHSVEEVELLMGAAYKVGVSLGLQVFPNG